MRCEEVVVAWNNGDDAAPIKLVGPPNLMEKSKASGRCGQRGTLVAVEGRQDLDKEQGWIRRGTKDSTKAVSNDVAVAGDIGIVRWNGGDASESNWKCGWRETEQESLPTNLDSGSGKALGQHLRCNRGEVRAIHFKQTV